MTCLFLPLNHFASKVVVGVQDNLMKARDKRVGLMNEVRLLHNIYSYFVYMVSTDSRWYSYAQGTPASLDTATTYAQSIRLQFMAWERSFEDKVLQIRQRELKYQQMNYHIEVCRPVSPWNGL